ncbi:MAG: hypothetical protein EOO01_19935 [Chitinophagaceae bacterium]|nr:MAG: hypothetical protein EOO01_19935 [Chitinophagaceae bacterium]
MSELKGWWNFMLPVDVDNDGDLDIIAGNLGLNSRVQASQEKPVTMYHYDFDDNGRKEQLLTYFVRDKEVPFASFAELSKQMPFIKKKFLYAGDFANAKLQDIFDPKTLRAASKYTADYFSSVILINNGTGQFEMRALPWEAQLTPYRDAVIINANGDNLPDILLTGNYFDSNTEIGRHDGEAVTLLINRGSGNFSVQRPGFLWLSQAQARHAANINLHNGSQNIVVATNNDSVRVLQIIGNARKSGSKDAVK